MRRAVLTIGGTVAGLAALFSFKTHSAAVAAAAPEPSPLTSSAAPSAAPSGSAAASASASKSLASPKSKPSASKSAQASASPTAGESTAPASAAPTTRAPTTPTAPATTKKPTAPATTPAAAPSTSAPAGKSGSFTGPTENTQYGQVEVQITVSSGKITNATELIQPEDSIGSNAISQLNSEVVSAQSASIQAVSGATYTSNGYISSLQSAVDQAGL